MKKNIITTMKNKENFILEAYWGENMTTNIEVENKLFTGSNSGELTENNIEILEEYKNYVVFQVKGFKIYLSEVELSFNKNKATITIMESVDAESKASANAEDEIARRVGAAQEDGYEGSEESLHLQIREEVLGEYLA